MFFELPIIESLQKVLSNYGNNFAFFFCLYVLIPFSLISSVICLILIFRKINSFESKIKRMTEISSYIQRGAIVYIKQQARVLFILIAIFFIPVCFTGIMYEDNPFLGFFLTGLIFLIGSISSLFAGYIGMKTATRTNILVVEASIKDPNEGFKLAYYGGMITGLLNICLLVFGLWLLFILTLGNIYLMISFGFGVSLAALLAQVGGGIYTKSADIGADLVGKYELSIKEDDPSNPAVIADLIGDNVGDCAGRGADLYESASSDSVSGMLLGLILYKVTGNPAFILINITMVALGVFSLFFSVKFLKVDFNKPSKSIWRIFIASTFFNVFVIFFLTTFLFGIIGLLLFVSSLVGLLGAFIAILLTIYYTSVDQKYTKKIAADSQQGPSVNILTGLSVGFKSVFVPVLLFVICVAASYLFGYYFGLAYYYDVMNNGSIDILGNKIDFYILMITFGSLGVSVASAASDLTISTILSFDTFGPIIDNASGIAEMGGDEAPEDLKMNLNKLDTVGNTTKAVAKGFALICGSLSSFVLFFTFLASTNSLAQDLDGLLIVKESAQIFDKVFLFNPLIIIGLFVGVALPFLFSAHTIEAVSDGAKDMVEEVRLQFKTIPGLKEGKAKPDYDRCINIAAKSALKRMFKPVILVVIVTLTIGILLGPIVIAGFLIGQLIGCLILGFFMSISGAAFDNAKKGIEHGLYGGKDSVAHKAAIIGDTVGDPLKDTTGPSMNILIKTINTISLTFLPLFITTGFLWVLFSFL